MIKSSKNRKFNHKINVLNSSTAIGLGKIGRSQPNSTVKHKIIFNNRGYNYLKWVIEIGGLRNKILRSMHNYMRYINHISQYKGLRMAVKINKKCRTLFVKYLAGDRNIDSEGVRLTWDSLPVKFKQAIKIIRAKNKKEIQFIMTVLTISRHITLEPLPDIGSITAPLSVGNLPTFGNNLGNFKLLILNRSNMKKKKFFNSDLLLDLDSIDPKPHLTTKSGPTGHALVSCLDDLENLPRSLLDSIGVLGGKGMELRINSLLTNVTVLRKYFDQPKSGKTIFRKISYFSDTEGKTRVVAIGDYWSQLSLIPLHDMLYNILSLIPQDQTFTQGKETFPEFKFDSNITYFCYDLVSFTDRFPLKLVKDLLENFIGKARAEAWYDIMVGYKFSYKDSKGNVTSINYEVGNPMGFYTSWASTTLTHHFIIYEACLKLEIPFSKAKYILLGDDIVLWDERLALEYKRIINSLGVDISFPKTLCGKTALEFAKRILTNFGEITPISYKGVLEHSKNYSTFIDYLHTLVNRGFCPTYTIMNCVTSFYKISEPWRAKAHKQRISRIEQAGALYNNIRGIVDDIQLVNSLIGLTSSSKLLSCNQRDIAKGVIVNATVQCFEATASQFTGDLKDRIFHAILENSDHSIIGTKEILEAIYFHPYTYVIGKYVEETYISQMKQASERDTFSLGNWDVTHRVLIGVDCRKLLSHRNYITKTKVNSILARYLKETIKTLVSYPY